MKKKNKKVYTFSVIISQDEDGVYIGSVPELRGCHTYGKTLPELYKNLEEVVALCVEVERDLKKEQIFETDIIGIQKLQFAV